MASLVYYPETGEDFISEALTIMEMAGIHSPTALIMIRYIEAGQLKELSDYSRGIWIVADPQMQKVNEMVGYITHDPYEIISVVNVGN
jgi:LEA14-like dessication related protein